MANHTDGAKYDLMHVQEVEALPAPKVVLCEGRKQCVADAKYRPPLNTCGEDLTMCLSRQWFKWLTSASLTADQQPLTTLTDRMQDDFLKVGAKPNSPLSAELESGKLAMREGQLAEVPTAGAEQDGSGGSGTQIGGVSGTGGF